MKLFISQPMKDKTPEQIKAEKHAIYTIVKNMVHEDIILTNNITEQVPENINTSLWYLGKSIEALSKSDAVYFASDWKDARGCRIEHECAIEYGVKIISD